jgi:hypothetical protein
MAEKKKKESFRGQGSVKEPTDQMYDLAFPQDERPDLGEPIHPEEVRRFSEVMGWLAGKLGMGGPEPQAPPPTPGIEQPTSEEQKIQERLAIEQQMGITRGEGAY